MATGHGVPAAGPAPYAFGSQAASPMSRMDPGDVVAASVAGETDRGSTVGQQTNTPAVPQSRESSRRPDPGGVQARVADAMGAPLAAQTVATNVAPAARPPQETADTPYHLVVDLRPNKAVQSGPAPATTGADHGMGRRWGTSWETSAQGWVGTDTGQPVWRPVVTTTENLVTWDIDTYLGIVTAEVAVEAHGGDFPQLGATLAQGRSVGMRGLVEEAVERGAHAVVSTQMSYTPMGTSLLITITGTAVTLRERV